MERKTAMSGYNPDRAIASVPIDKIHPGARSRSLCEASLESLAESIKTIGLQTPISIREDRRSNEERYILVVGGHRLEACRRLGKGSIDARIIDLDEIDCRLWEISENLHRAELTTLERSNQIAEWVKLSEERRQVAQVEPAVLSDGRKSGPQHQARGINAA